MTLTSVPCSSCREPVYWVFTDKRERMPIDVEPVVGGNLVLAAAESPPRVSVVSRGGRLPGTKLYISHFKTCPHAELHRRRTAEPPVQPRLNPPTVDLFGEVDR